MILKEKDIKLPIPFMQRFIEDGSHRPRLYVDAEYLHEDIRMNLQNLLNTHLSFLQWPNYFDQLDNSMWHYGIGDFSHYRYNNEDVQQQLCQVIKIAIERFEPRLYKVDVTLLENDREIERILQIRIEGVIKLASIAESAVFESNLDINYQMFNMA